MPWRGLGAWAQQRGKFLEQLLYLWWEGGDSLGAPGASVRNITCLGGGTARGCLQNLLLLRNYIKTKFSLKNPFLGEEW
jgi:hypothetical protein